MSAATEAFGGTFRGRRVLLTGHTGFKGSWLALWLQGLGAEVHGLALDPDTEPSHWQLLGLDMPDHRIDLRDAAAVAARVKAINPELVLHLAAQPLVRKSYAQPLETWSTNVMGTAHLLDACRHAEALRAILVVTTDKCYQNREWCWGYRENDALGGHDPYSASKAATEILVASYRESFFGKPGQPLLATARAGNVIGGGDWSADRLIPDLVRAQDAGQELLIRAPRSTRPWQHVLESLSGYLLLAEQLLAGRASAASAWNFGPDAAGNRSVQEVLTRMQAHWPALRWQVDATAQVHEAQLLMLDSARARSELGWEPIWALDQALAATAAWYQGWRSQGADLSQRQLQAYLADARALGRAWAGGA
ncbi:CDP-glucose 4,6-dehydratase [Paucibacter sp. APW11]|uniref:CDP-glucose 4,6-dehydratase n=1 Tax=Roseateles aquae TaxID=3077235 RepID=A0ABU3P8D1_9BURK|nr:CDP-glucose 4,6-dehydratase [Paucibacter sp. APW11]MDT8998825.1 CDP-glucose 4,6-dehydratase [Paucibacter sp. APW11]